MKNVTYLLGAGASKNAMPIQKELYQNMYQMADSYFKEKQDFNKFNNPYSYATNDRLMWDIGYFGNKAKLYGTIDTYARKLFLNEKDDELNWLKLAVNNFFTLWQLNSEPNYYKPTEKQDSVDNRYISLLASLLIKGDNGTNPVIPPNVNFITWNYDLQLELAYSSFCDSLKYWEDVEQSLLFTYKKNNNNQICHLNGYHGHYFYEKNEKNLLDRNNNSMSFSDILNKISFTTEAFHKRESNFFEHINYAWENNNIYSNEIRKRAAEIFENTDILVIIGYSFPTFNKDIDKNLFRGFYRRKDKREKKPRLEIYFQDPNANETRIKEILNLDYERDVTLKCISDKGAMEYFYLPYEF